ncbi:MAG: hypothetical protein OQL16_00900, partial [Gammaproteobacteria bacterium]|nr:hypothetical protein [Gammaproteobacteria bacterium]
MFLIQSSWLCLAETEYEKGWDYFKLGNYSQARNIWLPLAKQGDGDAAMGLAIIYENGLQTPRDITQSTRWYQVAADKGIPEAQHDLGIKYFTGNGVAKDLNRSFQLWKQAAETGLGSAQTKLAYLYLQGQGTPKNEGEALRWYRQASNQGNTEGMYNLSLMYKRGTGTKVNTHQYQYWLKQAAESDYPPAQYDLGLMMLYGKDMERSVSAGKEWLLRAANSGHAESQYYLGTLYLNGHILRPDKDNAIKLLTAAAKQGHRGAQQSLIDIKYLKPGSTLQSGKGKRPVSSSKKSSTIVEQPAKSVNKANTVVLGDSLVDKPPATTSAPVDESNPDKTEWLLKQSSDKYTIQLLASQNEASIRRALSQLPRDINPFIYRFRRNNT